MFTEFQSVHTQPLPTSSSLKFSLTLYPALSALYWT